VSVGPPGAKLCHRLGTLIGRPRRRDLLERLVPNGVGAELGVFRGEFSRELLEVARPRRLYLVDGWWELHGENFPREWGEYSGWGSASTRDAYMAARRVLAEYAPASTVCEIHVGDDLEFLAGLPDAHLDWAYLDSSHQYEHTVAELELLDAKVAADGRILGHDWIEDPESHNHGAYLAIRELCARRGWRVAARDDFTQWELERVH
jgi:hypothetical protein